MAVLRAALIDHPSDHFKIDNLRQRLDNLNTDPWQSIGSIRQKLPVSARRPPRAQKIF